MTRLLALIAAIAAVLLVPAVALGHHVISLDGQVDCQGSYTVHVTANVFGNVSLITKLNGVVIGTETPGGGDADHSYTYTGTGASVGDEITARVSDSQSKTTAHLAGPESCATPSPDSTPTPSPTPSPTPEVTPSPTPSEPVVTPTPPTTNPPRPTGPPTDVASEAVTQTSVALVGVAGILILFALAFMVAVRYLSRRAR